MTDERPTFSVRARHWSSMLVAAVVLSLPGCSSWSDMIPGHKEAEFRNRVQNDSFPTAAQAMQSPAKGDN